MKSKITLSILILSCLILTWCIKSAGEPEYEEAEKICVENEWEVTKDIDWNQICLFYEDKRCPLASIEEWDCFLINYEWDKPSSEYCIDLWWNPEYWQEWWEDFYVCTFDDDSFCYLDDLPNWDCKKGDMHYEDDNLYSYAEQACIDSNWEIDTVESWDRLCFFWWSKICSIENIIKGDCEYISYNLQDIIDIHEEEKAYQEYIAECYEQENIPVCWEDWNTYYNKCFMEKAWVNEEKELAEIISGQCVFW